MCDSWCWHETNHPLTHRRAGTVNPWIKQQFDVQKMDIKFLILSIFLIQTLLTNLPLIVHWAAPCVNSTPGPGLSRCDSFPARIPTVYHLNDSGGHLSPRLIVSATRTWHLSIAVRVIFHWWFSSALWSSLCKTLLSLIYDSGEGIWSLMNETKGW